MNYIEKWSISCHISKQGCHSQQQFQPLKCEFLSPDGAQKNSTCYLAAMRLKPLPVVSTEELGGGGGGCEKHMILAPDS